MSRQPLSDHVRRAHRSRWAAFGAAVAITAGAGGGIGLTEAMSVDSGAAYTAVTPCRLVDTRTGDSNVGPKAVPFTAKESNTFAARGAQGQCSAAQLPAGAAALALNVTALRASEQTFLTFWPGGTRPNASSLNPAPGAPPTPNAVITQLSADGSFDVYNDLGSVGLIVDVVGYFTNIDLESFVTEADLDPFIDEVELTAEFDSFLNALTGEFGPIKINTREIQDLENHIEKSRTVAVNRYAFHTPNSGTDRRIDPNLGAFIQNGSSTPTLVAPVDIPHDSVVTNLRFRAQDNNATNELIVRLFQVSPNGTRIPFGTATSAGAASSVREFSGLTLFQTTSDGVSYEIEVSSSNDLWGQTSGLQLVGVFLDYETNVVFATT